MKLMKIKDVAEKLAMSSRTLYQWKWRKRPFPFVKVGRMLRVDEEKLQNMISKNEKDKKI